MGCNHLALTPVALMSDAEHQSMAHLNKSVYCTQNQLIKTKPKVEAYSEGLAVCVHV